MNTIRDFVDFVQYSSNEDLLTKSQHLIDGAGLISREENPFWSLLFDLPPHAEYDFDVRHFFSVVPEEKLSLLTNSLIKRHQFVVTTFFAKESAWSCESGFVKSNDTRTAPLILHFTNAIDKSCLEFQSANQKAVEIVHAGIQFHCTSRERIDKTLSQGMKIAPLKEIERVDLLRCLEGVTQFGFQRPTWIRLDLSCLMASDGGIWATGLQIREILPLLEWLMRQTKLQGISIGPTPSSSDGIMARSAAQLIATLLYAYSHRRIVSSAHGKRTTETFS